MTLSKLSLKIRENGGPARRVPDGGKRLEKAEGVPIGTEETDRTGIAGGGILLDHGMKDSKENIQILNSGRTKYKVPSYVYLRTLLVSLHMYFDQFLLPF